MNKGGSLNKRQLFVRNLHFDLTEDILSRTFEEFGPLKNVTISKKSDGSSAGYGFVKYAFEDDAANAFHTLQGSTIMGRSLKLEYFSKASKIVDQNNEPGPISSDRLEETRNDDLTDEVNGSEDNIESATIRKSRQLLAFGVPVDVNKKMMKSVLSKISRNLVVELVKKDDAISEVAEVLYPIGKVFLLTAVSRKEGQKVFDVLNSTNLKNLGFSKFQVSADHKELSNAGEFDEDQRNDNNLNLFSLGNRLKDRLVPRFLADISSPIMQKRKCRLIIRNLSFQSTEKNVMDKMVQFGPLTSVEIPVDEVVKRDGSMKKRSKGFCFVTFLCEKDAQEAVKMSKEIKICNREVAIDFSLSKAMYEKYGIEPPSTVETDTNSEAPDINKGDIEEMDSVSSNYNPNKQERTQTDNISDVSEGKTVFVHGISFDTTVEHLKNTFSSYGDIEMAVIVKDKNTGISKGSAFIKFKNVDSVSNLFADKENKTGEHKKHLEINNRTCIVSLAVSKSDLTTLKESRQFGKDKRNLYLANEGISILAHADMLKADKEKRQKFQSEKKKKLQNPIFFVSNKRLSIRNLSKKVTNHDLKITCLKAVKKGLVDKELVSLDDLKHQLLAEGNFTSSVEKTSVFGLPSFDPKNCVLSAKIMFDESKIRDGKPQSRGYAFVEFANHIYALAALRELNNNPEYDKVSAIQDTSTLDKGRLIVEFTVENIRKVKLLTERKLKSQNRKIEESMMDSLNTVESETVSFPTQKSLKRKPENLTLSESKRVKKNHG